VDDIALSKFVSALVNWVCIAVWASVNCVVILILTTVSFSEHSQTCLQRWGRGKRRLAVVFLGEKNSEE